MISKKMEQMLNEQYNKEIFSAHLYLSMCSYFLDRDLDGFANYFKVQSQEELMHAEKQFVYLHDVDGKITMQQIDAPPSEFHSTIDCFERTLAHEKEVTKGIYGLVKQALDEGDFATHTFLQWFVTEQVEEEASVKALLMKLKMIGDNTSALYLLNDELLKRTLTVSE
ncbi:ferritin [Marinilongibacter aquaticus]|uniref:ferritin n=1 Tax=Marinilongibacter aquaticus TaxID=2975157 RepID=UPI0021BD01F1|nr:ferritin [Marinilongibacter aquaticus]UBM57938.1 ferritin [Marinilongibacter aquaticus]